MFYVFNSNNVCIGSCDFEPDINDLNSRGDYCKQLDEEVKIGSILEGDNSIEQPSVVVPEVDYEQLAKLVRDKIRSGIDSYVLPTSTIGDDLVTEEQKAILIQDSLLLARWSSMEGWPLIALPTLSDLTKSLIQVPVWDFPKETTGA